MLIRILKKSFDILWQNSVIIQPFILFMFLISLLLGSVGSFRIEFSPLMIGFLISAFALSCAFIAGWFQLFQAAIRNYAKKDATPAERAELSLGSFREFLPAVGRFFVPVTIAMILYLLLFFAMMKLAVILGLKYIGVSENISFASLSGILGDKEKVYLFVESLTTADRQMLLKWDMLLLFAVGFFSYITMFWFQAIIMNGENAVKSFFTGMKAVFANPFVTFGIFVFYWCSSFFTSFVSAIFPEMFLIQLLNLMLVVFITAYFIMINFVYFEEYSGNNIAGWTNIFR